jgi:hypothetical protein
MKRYLGAMMMVMGLLGAAYAADTKPASQPSTTSKPAGLACCGDKCKAMGANCCKADAAGKATCSMGGGCCVKP